MDVRDRVAVEVPCGALRGWFARGHVTRLRLEIDRNMTDTSGAEALCSLIMHGPKVQLFGNTRPHTDLVAGADFDDDFVLCR